MNNKAKNTLRIIAGAYIAYVGFDLCRGAWTDKPTNYMIFLIIGAAFIVLGGWLIIYYLKKSMQPEESTEDEESEDEKFEDKKSEDETMGKSENDNQQIEEKESINKMDAEAVQPEEEETL